MKALKHPPILVLLFIAILTGCAQSGEKTNTSETAVDEVETSGPTVIYDGIKTGSYIDWQATHLGGVNARVGKIYCKEGSVQVKGGSVSAANIEMDMNSMTEDKLDEDQATELLGHLKSPDFFDLEKHGNCTFELTKIIPMEGKYNSQVIGGLTILSVSKNITFKANIDVQESEVSIVSEKFEVDRSDWGLTYNEEGTAGVPLDYLISDEIAFAINVTVTKGQ